MKKFLRKQWSTLITSIGECHTIYSKLIVKLGLDKIRESTVRNNINMFSELFNKL